MKKTLFSLALSLLFSGICFSQWNIIYTANPAQTMSVIRFYNNSTGYCSSSLYNSSTFNIYKTTNSGANWTAQSSGRTGMGMTDLCVRHSDTAYFVGIYGTLLRTFNGGVTWDSAALGNYTHLRGITFLNSYTGFAVGDNGVIWKSTNKGVNWALQSTPLTTSFNRIRFVNQTTGFLFASANFVYKTTDAGATWTNLNFPYIGPIDFLREVVFTSENTGYVSGDIGRIRKTTDGGVVWTMLTTPTTEAMFSMGAGSANVLFACGGTGKVIKTTDAGATWTLQQTSLNENLYGMAMVSPDTGYICSWSGKILKTINGGTVTGVNPGASVVDAYYLGQNYPNPFNPKTIIEFSIPSAGFVSLKIFDINGREITTAINENLGSGNAKYIFDGANLTSGIYFYKLTVDNKFSEVKKMILIK
jgi:photosystem II stability/assembly factor-like uncharacterized protein